MTISGNHMAPRRAATLPPLPPPQGITLTHHTTTMLYPPFTSHPPAGHGVPLMAIAQLFSIAAADSATPHAATGGC